MKVKELMSEGVITVAPDATLKAVAALLVEHGISGVPVVGADGALLGVVSEGDILLKERGAAESPACSAGCSAVSPSRPRSSRPARRRTP